jgi:hypothetical protein
VNKTYIHYKHFNVYIDMKLLGFGAQSNKVKVCRYTAEKKHTRDGTTKSMEWGTNLERVP